MRALGTLLLALLFLAPSWAAPSGRSLTLVQWTDLHSGGPGWSSGTWGSVLRQGAALRPQAILMTGDNCDNKCSPAEFSRRVETFLATSVPRLRASGAPLLFCLGNNDFAANYQTDPENLAPVLAAYRRHLGRDWYLDDLGNGAYPRPLAGMAWLSLNSLIFSPQNHYENRGLQAERTFRWLREQLARQPEGRTTVILAHVPPTWDAYSHGPSWDADSLVRLQSILEDRRGPVVIVSGHFHRNEVHAFSFPDGGAAPVLDAGSLSEKYGGLANWRSYEWTLDPHGTPTRLAWRIRYPARPAWDSDYRFERPFLARTWSEMVSRLASDRTFRTRYLADFWARHPGSVERAARPERVQEVLEQFFVRPSLAVPAR